MKVGSGAGHRTRGARLAVDTTKEYEASAEEDRDAARAEGAGGPSLKSLAARGAAWTMGAYAAGYMLRLAGTYTLTRLLPQSAFGLAGLIAALMSGLQLFSDIGVGPSVVQNKRGNEPAFLNTAWTLSVGRGAALWVIASLLAWPFAVWNEQPQLAWLVPVAGLTSVVNGFASMKVFTQNRQLRLGRLSAMELGTQLVMLGVTVAWATMVQASVWALVAGWLAGSVLKMTLSHAALPGVGNRLWWDREAARSIVRFGRWIFLSTVLTFLVGQSDKLIFAKMIPMDVLGVYSVAAGLALMPATVLGSLAAQVVFPVYSRLHREGRTLGSVFAQVRRPVLLAGGWMLGGMIAGGPTIVAILLPASYAPAGWIVQVLAAGSWFSVLETTNGTALLATGKANLVAMGSAGKLVGMVVLIPAGYALGGFEGAVVGYASSEIARYAVSAVCVARQGIAGWRQDGALSFVLLGASLVGWVGAGVGGTDRAWVWAHAGIVFAGVSAVWAVVGWRELGAARRWVSKRWAARRG